jgi:hypothetical protein
MHPKFVGDILEARWQEKVGCKSDGFFLKYLFYKNCLKTVEISSQIPKKLIHPKFPSLKGIF